MYYKVKNNFCQFSIEILVLIIRSAVLQLIFLWHSELTEL